MSSRSHLLAAATALLVALWSSCAAAQSPPQPDPVDSDGITVIGTHDTPPVVDHFDLPPTSGPLYGWSKLGAYGLENGSSNTYFVPNNTAVEFQAFLDHPPAGASASGACWSATLFGACAGSTLPAGVSASVACGDFACYGGQWRREAAPYAILTYSQNFVAPVTGTYRVLAVGGGLDGRHSPGYVTGFGGSSGYVSYGAVTLVAGQTVAVTIGDNGDSVNPPQRAGATSFGGYVVANGGTMNSVSGGAGGGSGGGSSQGGYGGSCGSDGGWPTCGGCTQWGRGLGQGSSFSAYFSRFTRVTLACGAGGPHGALPHGGALGGGGGGGVVVNGVVIGGSSEGRAGYGYGAGGGGGKPGSGAGAGPGTPGQRGVVVVEW